MEIYVLYNLVKTLLDGFHVVSAVNARIIGLVAGFVLWIGFFLLQGFGLRKMGRSQGLKKTWMAFVPFVNILYIGKLVGICRIFTHKVKRAGMYAMIAQILVTIICALLVFSEMYLYIVEGEPQRILLEGGYYLVWEELTGFSRKIEQVLSVGTSALSMFQLVYELLMFIMLIALYRKYSVKNHTVLSLLSLLIPISRYIVIFVLRKNKPVDYEKLLRERQEAYMRRQQYYGNPYGNPYPRQNPTPPPTKPEGDPFEEFSQTNEKKDDGLFE